MAKLITILLIIGLILSPLANLAFGGPNVSFAKEDKTLEAPESMAELKDIGKKFLESFPKALGAAWQATIDIWREIANFIKNLWNSYIFPWFQNIWQKICSFFRKEIGKRRVVIEIKEEFKEEEKEEEISKDERNLWEKFWEKLKELIKR